MNKASLFTKSDFDGLVCAALLKNAGMVNNIVFVHGFDVEQGRVEIKEGDIMCNLPETAPCKLCFNYGAGLNDAKSSARLVYDYIGENASYENKDLVLDLLHAVDKAQSGEFTIEDVLEPKAWDMLNFIMDSRTGLGRVRAFRMSNYAIMMRLVDFLLSYSPDKILEMPDIKERLDYYEDSKDEYREMLEYNSREDGGILIIDLRDEQYLKPANRFMKYAIYPDCEVAIQIMWGLRQKNTVFALGSSIFSKSMLDLENIISEFGGMGHRYSGSIQVENANADEVLTKLIEKIKIKMTHG